MTQYTQNQKDKIASLYKGFRPDGKSHKFRLSFQIIDSTHDSANGTTTLGEITMNGDGEYSDIQNLAFPSPSLIAFTSENFKVLQQIVSQQFEEIAKSDKNARKLQLEMQKAAIENQIANL